MSYGGRGYSRGGYRGRGGGDGGSWRGSRGNFSGSSRGRFYTSSPSNYESRSRSYFQNSGNERYSNRGRGDDSYHRSYRQDSGDYSSRDYDFRSSPEPIRKRIRTEPPSYSGGPSRRSNERSFGSSGNDYSGRSFYISDKGSGGGYQEEKGSYREMREPRSGEYTFRKPGMNSRSPRGTFRGRSFSRGGRLRGRGFNRSAISSSGFISRRKTDTYLRKRYIPSKSQDYLRRLKLYRLKRRFNKNDDDKDKKSDDEDDDEDVEEEEDVDELGGKGDDAEVDDVSSQEGQEAADDKEEGEVEVDLKMAEDKASEDLEEVKEKSPKKKEIVKKPIKKLKKKVIAKKSKLIESGGSKSGDEKREGLDEVPKLTNYLGLPFIRLKCPHCNFSAVTFQEYSHHLSLKKHQVAMRLVFVKLRQTLARMRVEQRQKQRVLDEESQDNMKLRTIFCNICKLNYRTLKSHHMATRAHKKMMEFLFPFCKTCLVSFKTPMLYETHICELGHIKRKARLERMKIPPKEEDKGAIDSGNELDTSSFMVIDSVGSGDESEGDKSESNEDSGKADEEKKIKEKEVENKKKKPDSKLGAEYCKIVEAHFCDLCKTYLPRIEDKKRAVTIHCRSRAHLQRWMREVKLQRRRAATIKAKKERLVALKEEKKDEEEEESKEKKTEEEDKEEEEEAEGGDLMDKVKTETVVDLERTHESKESSETGPTKKPGGGDEKADQMWSEVDKDLSDLLNEVEEEANKSSEDEDDSRAGGGRYDRFKHDKSMDKAELKDSLEHPQKKSNTQANGSVSTGEKKKIEEGKASDK